MARRTPAGAARPSSVIDPCTDAQYQRMARAAAASLAPDRIGYSLRGQRRDDGQLRVTVEGQTPEALQLLLDAAG